VLIQFIHLLLFRLIHSRNRVLMLQILCDYWRLWSLRISLKRRSWMGLYFNTGGLLHCFNRLLSKKVWLLVGSSLTSCNYIEILVHSAWFTWQTWETWVRCSSVKARLDACILLLIGHCLSRWRNWARIKSIGVNMLWWQDNIGGIMVEVHLLATYSAHRPALGAHDYISTSWIEYDAIGSISWLLVNWLVISSYLQ